MILNRFFALGLTVLLSASSLAQPTQEEVKRQWETYYSRSKLLHKDDLKQISQEVKAKGKDTYQAPAKALDFGFEQYSMTGDFFKSEEGEKIVDIILSFQTPSGGWSKDVEMTKNKRRKGEGFGHDAENYVPTFDSEATTTQLQVLAKAVVATGHKKAKAAFLRGLGLIFNAQFPNGGFPQSYPLSGGYHDLITYNDNSMVNILKILKDISNNDPNYSFVPSSTRKRANENFLKGLNCILMTQVNTNGKFTAWGAQYDQFELTLRAGRPYEPASLASAESVGIVMFLMSIENPPAVVVQAVDDAMKWFESSKIMGYRWVQEEGVLTQDPNAAPLWARFYDPATNNPVFGDRDGKIYADVTEISKERQKNYSWYNTDPNKALKKYKVWRPTVKL